MTWSALVTESVDDTMASMKAASSAVPTCGGGGRRERQNIIIANGNLESTTKK
jgi:hypothetical protein